MALIGMALIGETALTNYVHTLPLLVRTSRLRSAWWGNVRRTRLVHVQQHPDPPLTDESAGFGDEETGHRIRDAR
jgi:hypothetical protein